MLSSHEGALFAAISVVNLVAMVLMMARTMYRQANLHPHHIAPDH